MKAKITVKGGINSIHHIVTALGGWPVESGKGMFWSQWFIYNSVKEAKDAIKEAGKSLREHKDPNYKKSKNNDWLSYDAATAEIIKLPKV